MMEIKLADARGKLQDLLAEAQAVLAIVRDRGAGRFSKAFALSGALMLGAYALVYSPAQAKMQRLEHELSDARIRAQFGGQYKELRDQLQQAYRSLPSDAQRDQWLADSVRRSFSERGLVTDDFKPVRETEQGGLIYQISPVAINLRFAEFYDWLQRVEASRPLMHVSMVDMRKSNDLTGVNVINLEIATVIPKRRFR